MVSIKNFLSTALLATLALAQAPTTNFSAADIASLASSTTYPTLAWCQAQRALCGTLCNGNAPNNTCEQATLNWTCNCANNNSPPALQYFQTSMLTFECNALLGKCLASHANDLGSQDNCKKTYICGNATDKDASNAAAAVASASTSSASSSSPTLASNSGSGGAGVTSSVAHAGAAAYGDYAPPMFIMMMVGAIASFL